MQIIMMKVSDLTPYANNPRKNDESVILVANSIKEFGFKVPIIIDKKNEIVTGHTRLKAAIQLGLKEVPCIIADDLNENQIKAFRLVDNKVGEFSKWDDELLGLEMFSINEIDLKDFGFDIYDEADFDTDFGLKTGEKDPFQKMTFFFADEQANLVKKMLKIAEKNNDNDNFGNTNENGNAFYRIVKEWSEQNGKS